MSVADECEQVTRGWAALTDARFIFSVSLLGSLSCCTLSATERRLLTQDENTCSESSDCTEDWLCVDGTCVEGEAPACQLASDCTTPPTCGDGNGASCVNSECVYPHAADTTSCSGAPCATGNVCAGSCLRGACVECFNDVGCGESFECVFNICRAQCGNDTGCEAGDLCVGDICQPVPTGCGNGVKEEGEACDDGNEVDTDVCLRNCVDARCGDNVVQAGVESCDDGDSTGAGDGYCMLGCLDTQVCGDDEKQGSETCDAGSLNGTGDGYCNGDCTGVQGCGDGVRDGNEVCDDGDLNGSGDGKCLDDCSSVQTCGDAVVEGTESCDDGANTGGGDGYCLGDCSGVDWCGSTVDDGADCDDEDLCTQNDVCTGGACAGAATDCTAASVCWQDGTCDPLTGSCVTQKEPDDSPCSDQVACSIDDKCLDGVCVGDHTPCCTYQSAELCFNGIDDDCNGLTDCEDTVACSPTAQCTPASPVNQLGVFVESGTACPDGYMDAAPISLHYSLEEVEACPSSNPACSCEANYECTVDAYRYSSNTVCQADDGTSGTPKTKIATVTADSACISIASTPISSATGAYRDPWVMSATGPCTPVGTPQATPPEWFVTKKFCVTHAAGGGCRAGNVCIPKSAPRQLCVLDDTAGECPMDYPDVQTGEWYTGYEDSRTCSCGCGPQTGGSCADLEVLIGANPVCVDGSMALNEGPTCYAGSSDFKLIWAVADSSATSVAPTCMPYGIQAAGTLLPTGLKSICCL